MHPTVRYTVRPSLVSGRVATRAEVGRRCRLPVHIHPCAAGLIVAHVTNMIILFHAAYSRSLFFPTTCADVQMQPAMRAQMQPLLQPSCSHSCTHLHAGHARSVEEAAAVAHRRADLGSPLLYPSIGIVDGMIALEQLLEFRCFISHTLISARHYRCGAAVRLEHVRVHVCAVHFLCIFKHNVYVNKSTE